MWSGCHEHEGQGRVQQERQSCATSPYLWPRVFNGACTTARPGDCPDLTTCNTLKPNRQQIRTLLYCTDRRRYFVSPLRYIHDARAAWRRARRDAEGRHDVDIHTQLFIPSAALLSPGPGDIGARRTWARIGPAAAFGTPGCPGARCERLARRQSHAPQTQRPFLPCLPARAWIMDPCFRGSHRPPGETSWLPGRRARCSARRASAQAQTLYFAGSHSPGSGLSLQRGPRISDARMRELSEVLALRCWTEGDARYRIVPLDCDGIFLHMRTCPTAALCPRLRIATPRLRIP